MDDEVEDPPFSFHALTASTMFMPADIFSLRKRLYSLGLRFSFFAGFLPSWVMVSCCFFSMSLRLLVLFFNSFTKEDCIFSIAARRFLTTEAWFFSSVASLVCTFLRSARRDFGIPAVFGMPQ